MSHWPKETPIVDWNIIIEKLILKSGIWELLVIVNILVDSCISVI